MTKNTHSTSFTISGSGPSLRKFLEHLTDTIDHAYEIGFSREGSQDWENIKSRGIRNADAKSKLYYAIFGTHLTKTTDSWQFNFTKCLDELDRQVPFLNSHVWNIVSNGKEGKEERFEITIAKPVLEQEFNATTTDKSSHDFQDDSTNIASGTSFIHPSPKHTIRTTPPILMEPVDVIDETSRNRFKPLTQEDEEEFDEDDEDDDEEIDKSFDFSEKRSSVLQDPNTQLKSTFTDILSEEDNNKIEEAIASGTINDMDINTIVKWIHGRTKALHLKSQATPLSEAMNNLVKDKYSAAIDTVISKAKSKVDKASEHSIDAINQLSNSALLQMTNSIDESKIAFDKLEASKKISFELAKQHDTTLQSIRNEFEMAFDRADLMTTDMESKIFDIIDDQKIELNAWISDNATALKDVDDAKNLWLHEIDLIRKEREALAVERQKVEIWLSNNQHHHPATTSTPLRTSTPIHPTVKNEQDTIDTTTDGIETYDGGIDDRNTSSSASRMTMNKNGVLPPPIPVDTVVRYKTRMQDVVGILVHQSGRPTWSLKHKCYLYDIMTYKGVLLSNCLGLFVDKYEDKLPLKQNGPDTKANATRLRGGGAFSPNGSEIHMDKMTTDEDFVDDPTFAQLPTVNSPPSQDRFDEKVWNREPTFIQEVRDKKRPLRSYEFEYPIGSEPKQVLVYYINKLSKDWDDIIIPDEAGVQAAYELLRSRLEPMNIHLRDWSNIDLNNDVAATTKENCMNFEYAYKVMSNSLFHFIDRNKETIFETYQEPLDYFATFRPNNDGFGFLQELVNQTHPMIKKHTVAQTSTLETPQFRHYKTINLFVNAYLAWLKDEFLQNRTYSEKEKLEHIIFSLDDRFATAVRRIKLIMEETFLDPLNPKPLPKSLQVTHRLAITIVNMIPQSERGDLTNAQPAKRMFLSELNTTRNHANINKMQSQRKSKANNEWAKDLKFELIKGAKCPGCFKSNHNVFTTGCSEIGKFATCYKFIQSQPQDKIDLVVKKYEEWQDDLRSKKEDRLTSDKRKLKVLKTKVSSKKYGRIHKTFVRSYHETFPDEKLDNPLPFDDFIDDSDDNSYSSDSSTDTDQKDPTSGN